MPKRKRIPKRRVIPKDHLGRAIPADAFGPPPDPCDPENVRLRVLGIFERTRRELLTLDAAQKFTRNMAKLDAGRRDALGDERPPSEKTMEAHRLYREWQGKYRTKRELHEAIGREIGVSDRQVRTYLKNFPK